MTSPPRVGLARRPPINSATIREQIVALLSVPERLPLTDAELGAQFWQHHPRFRFLKNAPCDARVLDVGAGAGTLARWKTWQEPDRSDLLLYGVDLAEGGDDADLYEDWEICNLDTERPRFSGMKFDAFFASHIIEHLASPTPLFAYMADAAARRAWVYLEWPSPETREFPTREELASLGFNVTTANFHDDRTHRQTYDVNEVRASLEGYGFAAVESGYIVMRDLGEELLARGRRLNRRDWRLLGLWAATGWCNCIVAVRR